MLKTIKTTFLVFLSMGLILSLFLNYIPRENDSYSVLDEETIELKMTIVSDCHLTGDASSATYRNFVKMLNDMTNCTVPNDVTVFLGDNTNHGSLSESLLFYGAIKNAGLKGPFVSVLGNHDTNNEGGVYDSLYARFKQFNSNYFGLKLTTPYYYQVINGYYFIVIASEKEAIHNPTMSDGQLRWFQNIMSEAGKSDKPVFVLSHHHYTKYKTTKSALYKTFQQYDNVFYLYGHTHNKLNEKSVKEEGSTHPFTVVNLPSLRIGYTKEAGEETVPDKVRSYIGYQLEVYSDRIVFRPRNYLNGIWATEYEETVTLSA